MLTNLILSILFSFTLLATNKLGNIVQSDDYPKNIILLIGDGMGLTQIQAAMTVNSNFLNLERCTVIGLAKTSSSDNYITDSAASATAMACGVKTYNGAIGVDSLGIPVKSILEYAELNSLATGLVATSSITHATPASFIAHNKSRANAEAIAKDFIGTGVDVFIGGGLKYFKDRMDKTNLLKKLKKDGYQIALNEDELTSINSGKIACLLSDISMPTMASGRGDMLLRSSKKAIEILNLNEKGFFLMIEGSQIDWGGHDNDVNYMVEELLDFDSVIGMVLDFAQQDGNTLVIITADHETGGLSILGNDFMNKEGDSKHSTLGHTAVMVPVYSYGPKSENFSGIYENTEIFYKMMDALGLINQARW